MASSSHIAPNKEGKIKARVSTTGRRGTFSKRITVYTNDPKNPRVMLSVVIEVVPPEHPKKPLQPSGSTMKPLQESPKIPQQRSPSTH